MKRFSWVFSYISVVFKTVIKKGKDYKDVIKLWAGPKLLVFLADPRDIELILSSQVYLDKSPEYRFFKPWLGNGLLISSGKANFRYCFYFCEI
jgi:cytochrome P450 family 4